MAPSPIQLCKPKSRSHCWCSPQLHKYLIWWQGLSVLTNFSICPLVFIVCHALVLATILASFDYSTSLLTGVPHSLLPLQTMLHSKLFKSFLFSHCSWAKDQNSYPSHKVFNGSDPAYLSSLSRITLPLTLMSCHTSSFSSSGHMLSPATAFAWVIASAWSSLLSWPILTLPISPQTSLSQGVFLALRWVGSLILMPS